jgi:cell division transport system permease protein
MTDSSRTMRRITTGIRSGLRGMRSAPLVFFISVSTMAIGLLLLGAFMLVVQNMRGTLERVGDEFSVVAFLPVGVEPTPSEVAGVRKRLEGLQGVAKATYVSRAEALERLRSDLGKDSTILEELVDNPLPASFELVLATNSRTPDAVRDVAAAARNVEGIDDARYGEAWVEGYSKILVGLGFVGLAFGSALALALGVIIAGTVRLAVYARADEIQIQRLVGAGALYVRLPFYVQAVIQGAIGAVVAVLLLYGLFRSGLPFLSDPIQFLIGRAVPTFFGPIGVLSLIGIGISLGLLSAVVSLLRVEES